MPIIQGHGGPTDFYPRDIGYACRFNDDDGAYLSKANFSGDGTKTKVTFSFWMKMGNIEGGLLFGCRADASNYTYLNIDGNFKLTFVSATGGTIDTQLITTQLFRDPTSWYHIVVFYDSTPAVPGSGDIGIYVNGTQVTAFDTETYGAQNDVLNWNEADNTHEIVAYDGDNFFDGYLAEVIVCDGQKYAASDFGEDKNGIWVPKTDINVTYGTNGFYLNFETAPGTGAGAGDDVSGNGNDFTENNLAASDQVTDTPTNNFAIFSGIAWESSTIVNSEGNTKVEETGAAHGGAFCSFKLPSSGKWYMEMMVDEITGGSHRFCVGIVRPTVTFAETGGAGMQHVYFQANTVCYDESSTIFTDTGNTISTSEVVQFAIDIDNDKLWFGIDDSWYDSAGGSTGDPAAGSNPCITGIIANGEILIHVYYLGVFVNTGNPTSGYTGGNVDGNGYGSFEYAPPHWIFSFVFSQPTHPD